VTGGLGDPRAFLRTPIVDREAELRGDRVYLRHPVSQDYAAWAELRAMSRHHLTPWEPKWSRDELTRSCFRRRLRQFYREQRDDQGYAYLIFQETGGALIGGLSISNVRRGVAQAASVGYWIGLPFAGQGLMTDAAGAAVRFVFDRLGLNRLEAACLPSNVASARVLEKTGFVKEGRARRYLKINDQWQDHDLYAILRDDVTSAAAGS
jgi:ribosomal-protein-alanine N-acetyltransferase